MVAAAGPGAEGAKQGVAQGAAAEEAAAVTATAEAALGAVSAATVGANVELVQADQRFEVSELGRLMRQREQEWGDAVSVLSGSQVGGAH